MSSDPSLAGPLDDLIGSSINYRIAVGPRTGQKVFTLRTVPAQGEEGEGRSVAAEAGGFSLHAGLDIQTRLRTKLERLCLYVSRPPRTVVQEKAPSGQQISGIVSVHRKLAVLLEQFDARFRSVRQGLDRGRDMLPLYELSTWSRKPK